MTKRGDKLHAEHQALMSYYTSKAPPSETARILYNVLLLAAEETTPDVVATIRYCLEDARIGSEIKKVLRQKAADVEHSYYQLNDDHVDVKYSLGSRTEYDEFAQKCAAEMLDAVNEFYTAAGTLDRATGRKPVTINDTVLNGVPRVIHRLGNANPHEHLSHPATPQLKELMERSKNVVDTTEFIWRDWA